MQLHVALTAISDSKSEDITIGDFERGAGDYDMVMGAEMGERCAAKVDEPACAVGVGEWDPGCHFCTVGGGVILIAFDEGET